MGGWRYYEMRKQQLPEPVEKEVHVYMFLKYTALSLLWQPFSES
jgi:hypothetical protein